MDVDRYIATHGPTWSRLEELTGRARRSASRLDPDELDELLDVYQRTSSHLAHVRTAYGDPVLVDRLTRLVGSARGVVYRHRSSPVRAVTRWITATLPGAIWRARRNVGVAALLLFGPAVGVGVWLGVNDQARNVGVPPETQRLVAERQFRQYYSSSAAEDFQTQVTVNNVLVGASSFATGILGGVPTAYLLVTNGVSVGVAGAVMHASGQGAQFWGLITPHGLLELTAVTIAAGAGLRLGWTLVSPGDRTRGRALAEEGQRAMTMVLGATMCFVVAGFIEAWITPSGLPTAARVSVGVLVELLFGAYVIGLGRRAELAAAAERTAPAVLGQSRPSALTTR